MGWSRPPPANAGGATPSAFPTDGGRERRLGRATVLRRFLDPGTLVVLAVWLAVTAWRPFLLGFYHDDWHVLALTDGSAPFSWERLSPLAALYANRPAVIPIHFTLSSLCGQSAPAWHIAGALLLLVALLALQRFLRRLTCLWGPSSTWAADLAAAVWLLYPWSHGYRLWPVMTPALVAIALVAWSAHELLATAEGRRPRYVLLGLAYLAAVLIYEVFYLSFVPLAAVVALAGLASRRLARRPLLVAAAVLTAAQLVSVGYNRLAPLLFDRAPTKGFSPAWLWLTGHSLSHLPARVTECLSDSARLVSAVAIALGIAWLLTGLAGAIFRNRFRALATQVGAVAIAAGGAVLAVALFAVAGYEVVTIGGFSRTMLGIDLWLAVALAIILTPLMGWPRPWSVGPAAAVCALAAGLGHAYADRASDWAGVWRQEQHVLAAAPRAALRRVPPPAVIVLDQPTASRGVGGFGAPWDLDPAMRMLDRELERLDFLVAFPQYPITWDGETVIQHGVGRWPARQLWLWTGQTGDLSQREPPVTIPESNLPQ